MLLAISSITIISILISLAVFQLLLVLGKPYGAYAWGGNYTVLPKKLRYASAVSIVLYGLFMVIAADAAGWVTVFNSSLPMLILALYMTLGIFMNAISRSKKERIVMTPLVTVMAICSWALALA